MRAQAHRSVAENRSHFRHGLVEPQPQALPSPHWHTGLAPLLAPPRGLLPWERLSRSGEHSSSWPPGHSGLGLPVLTSTQKPPPGSCHHKAMWPVPIYHPDSGVNSVIFMILIATFFGCWDQIHNFVAIRQVQRRKTLVSRFSSQTCGSQTAGHG